MKKILRIASLSLSILLGLTSPSLAQDKIPVLAYHHILRSRDIGLNKQEKNENILALAEFEKQMNYLKDQGFYTASMEELEAHLNGRKALPKKTVLISFDDGYLSNKLYAYPVLKKHGQKASIFMITSLIHKDRTDFNPRKIQFLRMEDMAKISDVFSFHSHTHDMHRGVGTGLPLLFTSPKEEVKRDLLHSKRILNTSYLAYPSGVNSPLIIGELKDSGYKMAFTIAPGYIDKNTDPYRLPRFNIGPSLDFHNFKKIVNGEK